MQVFYYNAGTGKDVPAAAPINIESDEALKTFHGISAPDSFFGVILPDARTLQMMFQRDGMIYIEQLGATGFDTLSVVGDRALGEAVIRAAFDGNDPNFELPPFYPKWKPGSVV